MALHYTITPRNGIIWPVRPVEKEALVCVLTQPASKVNQAVRPQSFTTVAYDEKSEHMAGVDTAGNVYNFNLKANRVCKLETAGTPGTCCCFSPGPGRLTLFVGFVDCSIRAYDITKSVALGILREHRSPPSHLVYRARTAELLSTSVDAVILWDAKKLCRRRALGSGPAGPVQATFTADEEQIVTMFKDGSFYVWHASSFSLVRSFLLPAPARLRRMQHAFAVSPDGELLVSAGLRMGVLLVYSLISGALLHAVRLPDTDSISGATQLEFLPDSATVAVMCSDGGVRCIDVKKAALVLEVPNIFPDRRDMCTFTMDKRANSLAVVSDGKVLLYNLAIARKDAPAPQLLSFIPPEHVESAHQQVPLQLSGVCADDDTSNTRDARAKGRATSPRGRTAASPSRTAAPACKGGGGGGGGTAAPGSGGSIAVIAAGGTQAGLPMPLAAMGDGTAAAAAAAAAAAGAACGKAGPPTEPDLLNRRRLTTLLQQFGEYPAKYRLSIWGFLLDLPHNQMAFQVLVNRGLHESCAHLVADSPLQNRALTTRLAQALSQLAHWCPVFASVGFMPGLVFPFVKLHAAGATSGSNESCFEMLATLLMNWTRGWFECFPDPPLGILSRLDTLLAFHDKDLAVHLGKTCRGGVPTVSWSLMQDLLTGVLALTDWLKLWDHCFTVGPDFLYFFLTSYFMAIKPTITSLDTENKIATFLGKPPTIDMNKVIRGAYQLRQSTPDTLRPATAEWAPLPKTGTYTEFTQYPAAGVELFAQERKKVVEAEEALARRRRIVADLAIKSKATALQANSLALERKQLGELQHERREQLRQLEQAMLEETRRLEDKAKEEKLKQISLIEASYQDAAEGMRQEWQRELEYLRQDISERRRMMAAQVQSKEEEEQVNILEFKARQRLTALEAETAQAAMLAKMRDEAHVKTAEIEAKQRSKMRQWEAEEEARRLKLQHEDARRHQMTIAAEDAAAQAAVRKELMAAQLAAEDQTTKLEAERRLRDLAEEQGRITVTALETERQRMAARAAADEQALALQAAADAAWYEAETARRNALLAAERDSLRAAEQQAVQKLEETEAKIKLYGGQAALLERRRAMETITAEEKAQALRLVDAIAVERARAATLTQELLGREEELAAVLAMARRTGTTQEAPGATSADLEAARVMLAAAQQQDLEAMRRAHQARMEQIYGLHQGPHPGGLAAAAGPPQPRAPAGGSGARGEAAAAAASAANPGPRRTWEVSGDDGAAGGGAPPSVAWDGSSEAAGGGRGVRSTRSTAWEIPAGPDLDDVLVGGVSALGSLPPLWPHEQQQQQQQAAGGASHTGSLTAEEWAAARTAAGLGDVADPSGTPSVLGWQPQLSPMQPPPPSPPPPPQQQQQPPSQPLGALGGLLPSSLWQRQQQQQQQEGAQGGSEVPAQRLAELDALRAQVAALQARRTSLQQVLLEGGIRAGSPHDPPNAASAARAAVHPSLLRTPGGPPPAYLVPSTPTSHSSSSPSYTCIYDTPPSTTTSPATTATTTMSAAASLARRPGLRAAAPPSGSSATPSTVQGTTTTTTTITVPPSSASASAPRTSSSVVASGTTGGMASSTMASSSAGVVSTSSSSEPHLAHRTPSLLQQQQQQQQQQQPYARRRPPLPPATPTTSSSHPTPLPMSLAAYTPTTSHASGSTPASGSVSGLSHTFAPMLPVQQQGTQAADAVSQLLQHQQQQQQQAYLQDLLSPSSQGSRMTDLTYTAALAWPSGSTTAAAASASQPRHRGAHAAGRSAGAGPGTKHWGVRRGSGGGGTSASAGSRSSSSSGTSGGHSVREGVESWSDSSSSDGGSDAEGAGGARLPAAPAPRHPPAAAAAAAHAVQHQHQPLCYGAAELWEPGAAAEQAAEEVLRQGGGGGAAPGGAGARTDAGAGAGAGAGAALQQGMRMASSGVGASTEASLLVPWLRPGGPYSQGDTSAPPATPPPRPSASHASSSSSPLLSASGLSATESARGYGRQGAQATRTTPRTTGSTQSHVGSSGSRAATPSVLGGRSSSSLAHGSSLAHSSSGGGGSGGFTHSSSSRGGGSLLHSSRGGGSLAHRSMGDHSFAHSSSATPMTTSPGCIEGSYLSGSSIGARSGAPQSAGDHTEGSYLHSGDSIGACSGAHPSTGGNDEGSYLSGDSSGARSGAPPSAGDRIDASYLRSGDSVGAHSSTPPSTGAHAGVARLSSSSIGGVHRGTPASTGGRAEGAYLHGGGSSLGNTHSNPSCSGSSPRSGTYSRGAASSGAPLSSSGSGSGPRSSVHSRGTASSSTPHSGGGSGSSASGIRGPMAEHDLLAATAVSSPAAAAGGPAHNDAGMPFLPSQDPLSNLTHIQGPAAYTAPPGDPMQDTQGGAGRPMQIPSLLPPLGSEHAPYLAPYVSGSDILSALTASASGADNSSWSALSSHTHSAGTGSGASAAAGRLPRPGMDTAASAGGGAASSPDAADSGGADGAVHAERATMTRMGDDAPGGHDDVPGPEAAALGASLSLGSLPQPPPAQQQDDRTPCGAHSSSQHGGSLHSGSHSGSNGRPGDGAHSLAGSHSSYAASHNSSLHSHATSQHSQHSQHGNVASQHSQHSQHSRAGSYSFGGSHALRSTSLPAAADDARSRGSSGTHSMRSRGVDSSLSLGVQSMHGAALFGAPLAQQPTPRLQPQPPHDLQPPHSPPPRQPELAPQPPMWTATAASPQQPQQPVQPQPSESPQQRQQWQQQQQGNTAEGLAVASPQRSSTVLSEDIDVEGVLARLREDLGMETDDMSSTLSTSMPRYHHPQQQQQQQQQQPEAGMEFPQAGADLPQMWSPPPHMPYSPQSHPSPRRHHVQGSAGSNSSSSSSSSSFGDYAEGSATSFQGGDSCTATPLLPHGSHERGGTATAAAAAVGAGGAGRAGAAAVRYAQEHLQSPDSQRPVDELQERSP